MNQTARTILIGDVHGCVDELCDLLKACEADRGDRVVLVGDLVAKGPDSPGVVALARERGFLAVRGNHDEAVLRHRRASREGAPVPHLKPTHLAVVEALQEDDWIYLENLPLYLEFPELDLWVVHAGVVPGRSLAEQRPEDLLVMRTLRPDGTPSSKLGDGELWAKLYRGPQHVVFGHDAITGLQQHPFATGLDTGCVYGRVLTALILPERRLIAVPARRVYVEPKP